MASHQGTVRRVCTSTHHLAAAFHPSCPTFPQPGFAAPASRRRCLEWVGQVFTGHRNAVRGFRFQNPSPCTRPAQLQLRYYAGSDSCRCNLSDRSPRLPRLIFTTFHLQPHHVVSRSLLPSAQRRECVPGFATSQRARHDTPPNRVRHPTDRCFVSGCSPPHFTVTQLPSTTGSLTDPHRDFHPANQTPSRAHWERAPARDWSNGRKDRDPAVAPTRDFRSCVSPARSVAPSRKSTAVPCARSRADKAGMARSPR